MIPTWFETEALNRRLRRPRHRNDPSVQTELESRAATVDLARGLELQWLGTAGFRLTYEGFTILIDPYVSRRSLSGLATRRPLLGDPALVDRLLPECDAVLLGHTHFDHAVDAGYLAATRGVDIYGSASAHGLLQLLGTPERAVVVEAQRTYDIGPFAVRFIPSLHSRLIAGWKVPFDGEFTCDHLDHLGFGAYRCGQTWGIQIKVAGTTLYHQGSADLIDAEVPSEPTDIALRGIAGRLYTDNFAERMIRALRPSTIVAHHHDDFFRPVEGDMGFSLNVNLGGFVEDIERIDPSVKVLALAPLETVSG